MIPAQLQPIQTSATSPLPNIGNFLGVSGNAPQVPPAFAGLPPGTLLKGFVLNRAAGGTPVLRTDVGDFLVQSSAFLRIGAEVSIRLRAAGVQIRADIVEVDGKPVSNDAAKSGKGGDQLSTNRGDAWQARQDTIQQTRQLPSVDNQGNVRGDFQFAECYLIQLMTPPANYNFARVPHLFYSYLTLNYRLALPLIVARHQPHRHQQHKMLLHKTRLLLEQQEVKHRQVNKRYKAQRISPLQIRRK